LFYPGLFKRSAGKSVIIIDRGFAVVVTGSKKKFGDRLILATNAKYPLIIPIKILRSRPRLTSLSNLHPHRSENY